MLMLAHYGSDGFCPEPLGIFYESHAILGNNSSGTYKIDTNYCTESQQNYYMDDTEFRVIQFNAQSFLLKFAMSSTVVFAGPMQVTSF